MNLLGRILSTDFMPHGYCFLWVPEILWLHVVSDALIALAYFAIPVTLVTFAARRRELPFPWLFLLFATFIICCGTTHLMEIWTVWSPDYGAAGLVKAVCALFSVTTAAAMIPVVPKALALRSPRELEAVNLRLAEEVDQHKATAGALAQAHDELERRVRERTAELAASESRYRALVEAMASVVWRADAAGLVEDMPEWRALTGQTVAEVRGWGWLDALHPDDRGPTRDAWLRALGDGTVCETEYRIRTRDGAWRWYAVRGVPVRGADGTAREWVGVCIDIDERKRAEAELRESEERYRTLVDTAPDAVFVHQDGIVILANREAVALFGAADPAELVGRPVEDLIDPGSLELARARYTRLREPGQRNELAEMRYRRLDGVPFAVEVASAAVPVGGRLAVQVAFRDIGARKAAEAHQHLLVQELAHRVKNTLAVVQGIAARSLADGRTLAEARDVLTERLRALASAHTLLFDSGWRGGEPARAGRDRAGALRPAGRRQRGGRDADAEGGAHAQPRPARAGDQRRQARRALRARGPGRARLGADRAAGPRLLEPHLARAGRAAGRLADPARLRPDPDRAGDRPRARRPRPPRLRAPGRQLRARDRAGRGGLSRPPCCGARYLSRQGRSGL
jgi:PAS domain S-box-containing protein